MSVDKKNRKFFEQLKDVEQVYSYGFSYGKVDLPYIKEIINNISNNKNSKWFFYDYNIDENKKYNPLVSIRYFHRRMQRSRRSCRRRIHGFRLYKGGIRRKGSQYPASVRIYGGACYLQWPDILDKHTH